MGSVSALRSDIRLVLFAESAGRERLAKIRDGSQAEEVCGSHQKPVPRRLEVQGDENQAEGCGALLHRQGEACEGCRRYVTLAVRLTLPPAGLQLALRAGNEKEEGETADTVGCCSLRVEHIKLYPEIDGQEFVVEFDFLGKDSIRYYNKVPVEKRVPVLPFPFVFDVVRYQIKASTCVFCLL